MKWRILEVTPSIPKDFYRIRAWFGRALHMTSENRAVSLVPREEKQHEEVRIEFCIQSIVIWNPVVSVGSRTSWKWKMHHQEHCGQFLPWLGNGHWWYYESRENQFTERMDCQECQLEWVYLLVRRSVVQHETALLIIFLIGSLQPTNRFAEQRISHLLTTTLQRYDLHCHTV